jgi:prepilin-type N-terminal cleavage/methylation domain-containing protein
MKNTFTKAFTLIELILVIVILGIAAKFGMELLMRAYEDYIYGVSNNRLLGQSEAAVTQIANRLQYRIKESIVFRQGGDVNGTFINTYTALASANNAADNNTTVVEWVGYDIDGWHGDGSSTAPTWSGIVDLKHAGANAITVISPESNGTRISGVIDALSPRFLATGTQPIPALFFIGDESVNVNEGFAWDGNSLINQTKNLHPVTLGDGLFSPRYTASGQNFGGVDVYEYYRLAWTAYALELRTWIENPTEPDPEKQIQRGTLWLYYDYRPWLGENYAQDGKKVVLMENVQTLRFTSVGDVLKVQVCVGDGNIFKKGAYSVCKEKTIF